MWEDWGSYIQPDRRAYWKMAGPIEVSITLRREGHREGSEWSAYLERYATITEPSGLIFLGRFETLETAEAAAFQIASEDVARISRAFLPPQR